MTPHEVNLAFDGFLTKLEWQGNVMLMAIRQQNVKKAKLINLHNDEQNGKSNASVKMSTNEARQETLAALGILCQ